MEAVSITWFHRKHGISPEVSDFRSIQLAANPEPGRHGRFLAHLLLLLRLRFQLQGPVPPFLQLATLSVARTSATLFATTSPKHSHVFRKQLNVLLKEKGSHLLRYFSMRSKRVRSWVWKQIVFYSVLWFCSSDREISNLMNRKFIH